MTIITRAIAALGVTLIAGTLQAAPITVINHSFEDDPNNNFEFFFGNPTGWSLFDPGGIADPTGPDVQGTLTVTGSSYFGGVAPDGDNVAILFIGDEVGTTEFGLEQMLTGNTLQANTQYSLTVAVGNIESGPTENFGFFNLDGFPGYRIELLAGTDVIASIDDGIDALIDEGEFVDVTLDFITGAAHVNLGDTLGIRLVNRNLTDPAHVGADLDVDFDNVRLDATPVIAAVPEPATALLMAGLVAPIVLRRRRRS